jgi:hypothetical protein
MPYQAASVDWRPERRQESGFQGITEYPAPGGQVIDVLWLRGPAQSVTVSQHGQTWTMTLALWSNDPMAVAAWVERTGTPVGNQPGQATRGADLPTFTAVNPAGKALYTQDLEPPRAMEPKGG